MPDEFSPCDVCVGRRYLLCDPGGFWPPAPPPPRPLSPNRANRPQGEWPGPLIYCDSCYTHEAAILMIRSRLP